MREKLKIKTFCSGCQMSKDKLCVRKWEKNCVLVLESRANINDRLPCSINIIPCSPIQDLPPRQASSCYLVSTNHNTMEPRDASGSFNKMVFQLMPRPINLLLWNHESLLSPRLFLPDDLHGYWHWPIGSGKSQTNLNPRHDSRYL